MFSIVAIIGINRQTDSLKNWANLALMQPRLPVCGHQQMGGVRLEGLVSGGYFPESPLSYLAESMYYKDSQIPRCQHIIMAEWV